MTIATTSDLPLSWGAASSGDAILHLSDDAGHVAVCFFDASARRGAFPRSYLSSFKSIASGAVTAIFYVAARNTQTGPHGWTMQASAVTWYGASWSQAGEVTLE
jgi:hypothetical protein